MAIDLEVKTEYDFSIEWLNKFTFAMWDSIILRDHLVIHNGLRPSVEELMARFVSKDQCPRCFVARYDEDTACDVEFAKNMNALCGFIDHVSDPKDGLKHIFK